MQGEDGERGREVGDICFAKFRSTYYLYCFCVNRTRLGKFRPLPYVHLVLRFWVVLIFNSNWISLLQCYLYELSFKNNNLVYIMYICIAEEIT